MLFCNGGEQTADSSGSIEIGVVAWIAHGVVTAPDCPERAEILGYILIRFAQPNITYLYPIFVKSRQEIFKIYIQNIYSTDGYIDSGRTKKGPIRRKGSSQIQP